MKEINKCIEQLSENEQKRYRYELSKMDEAQIQRLETLVARMVKYGAKRPLSWAWSEFKEGIPQWARFMILKSMYVSIYHVKGNVDSGSEFNPRMNEVYQEIVAVTGEERLKQFLIAYGKGMLYTMLDVFDEGNTNYESNDSWVLVQYDREKEATGKPISGLHEDFLDFEQEINL